MRVKLFLNFTSMLFDYPYFLMNGLLPNDLLLVIRPGEKMEPLAASVNRIFQPITSTTDPNKGAGRITDLRSDIIFFRIQVLEQFPFAFEFNSLLLEVTCHAYLVNYWNT